MFIVKRTHVLQALYFSGAMPKNCSVLQCIVVCELKLMSAEWRMCVAVCCSVIQYVAVCCRV